VEFEGKTVVPAEKPFGANTGKIERFRMTLTANGKRQIQVKNFSTIGNEQIKSIQRNLHR